MARGIFLPPARTAPARGLAERAKTFFVERWSGRVLLGALALRILCALLPFLPRVAAILADLVLLGFAVFFAFRLARAVLRRLLWRIRTKLLVSYLFIALVPVVLLGLFFFIASFLFVGLVASQLVTGELTRGGQVVKAAAHAAATALPPADAAARSAFASRLKAARGLPPNLAYAFARRGRVVAVTGDVPQTLPAWLKDDEFAGVVRPAKERNVFRIVWRQGADYALFDVPMDTALFADLEKQTGIHVFSRDEVRADLSRHRRGRKGDADGGDEEEDADFVFGIDGDDQAGTSAESARTGGGNQAPRAGLAFVALAERFDWETGKKEIEPLTFQFQPLELFRRLSPGLIPWEREEKRR